MRTKDEILKGARDDITNPHYGDKAPFWLEYRKIEVLLDIRDQVHENNCILIDLFSPETKQALIDAGILNI